MEALDRDTQKLLSDGEQIESFVSGNAWGLIKKKLTSRLVILDSISQLPSNLNKEDFIMEAKIREGVVSIIIEWIRDVEGEANRSKSNKEVFALEREESIVQFFD